MENITDQLYQLRKDLTTEDLTDTVRKEKEEEYQDLRVLLGKQSSNFVNQD